MRFCYARLLCTAIISARVQNSAIEGEPDVGNSLARRHSQI